MVVGASKQQHCVAVVEEQFSHHEVWKFTLPQNTPRNAPFAALPWKVEERAGYLPKERQQKEALIKLGTYLAHHETMKAELAPILKKIARKKTITVMCLNKGMLDLVLNFICSARHHSIDIGNLVVFSADRETHELVTSFGVQSFHHAGFGKLPANAVGAYVDATFVALM